MLRRLTLAATLLALPAFAGSIKGRLKLAGVPAESMVVYLDQVAPDRFELPKTPQRLSQRGARFSPAVLPIVQNAEVDMTNDDWVTHSVFSKSDPKTFDLGLYPKESKKTVKFETLGRVDVFCSIHPRMKAVILVLQNPFFTRPDDSGLFLLENVPPGSYTLKVFQPDGPERTVSVKVPEKGDAVASL